MGYKPEYLNRVCISAEIKQRAENFISSLKNNDIIMLLPPDIVGIGKERTEVVDYLAFDTFLTSRIGRCIVEQI